ncbi:MAG: manganese efflux pump MntP family protein [Bacteroidales bacterium]
MDYFSITAIAAGLCLDTFAVSLSMGVVKFRILFRQALRVALILAIFQGGLTVAGYFLGSFFSDEFRAFGHWIALGLLTALGIRMIVGSFRKKEKKVPADYDSLIVILTLALGTSIDAFAVGISFAFLDVRIWIAGFIIGTVTFLASMTAIRIGKLAGKKIGQIAEIIGGLILIAIGVKILIEHFLA